MTIAPIVLFNGLDLDLQTLWIFLPVTHDIDITATMSGLISSNRSGTKLKPTDGSVEAVVIALSACGF